MTPVAAGSRQKVLARSQGIPVQLRSASLTVSISLDADSWAIQAAADRDQLALDLQGVEFNGPPTAYYEIYLDLPAETRNPSPGIINFVGKLTPRMKRELTPGFDLGARVSYSVGGIVRALTKSAVWNPDVLTVTFVPRGISEINHRASTVRARIAALQIVSAN